MVIDENTMFSCLYLLSSFRFDNVALIFCALLFFVATALAKLLIASFTLINGLEILVEFSHAVKAHFALEKLFIIKRNDFMTWILVKLHGALLLILLLCAYVHI